MGRQDVAIVGSACLLPEADCLDALHDNLSAGRQSVRPPSAQRVRHTGGSVASQYFPLGHLDRVDLFDHSFFGMSLREAELMDPAHRLIVQLAHQAIENSGYAPGGLRGTRTAVVFSGAPSGYDQLLTEDDPQELLGVLPASLAARVSYLFDLTGPALVVDTACSSSLVALSLAVDKLRSGAVDLAIAGGVSVNSVLLRSDDHVPLRGVSSPHGVCRPFDAEADGTVAGEGGGVVVLKRLPDALSDNDNILAVLKGVGVNHDGYRGASMAAPSQAAQAEAIVAAWRDAGVEAGDIGYIECHGSGTPLGDVVEVEALCEAFAGTGVAEGNCAIGSVKGNVGHLDHAAGMAGLFKALLSVRRGVQYPAVHFRTPNPMVDFSGPVHVNTEMRDWPGTASRRQAGLSSFGITGTNVHVVLEQPPQRANEAPGAEQDQRTELVTVSAKSASALRRYCELLADFAGQTEHSLRAVAHAMNRGRDDYAHRLAFTVDSTKELSDVAREAVGGSHPVDRDVPVVLLFSGDGLIDDTHWAELDATVPEIAANMAALRAELAAAGPDGRAATADVDNHPAVRLIARQIVLHRALRSLGLTGTQLAGSGLGNLVVRVDSGKLSLAEAVAAAAGSDIRSDLDRSRLRAKVQDFADSGAVLVEMGSQGVLSREIRSMAPELPIVSLLAGAGHRGLLDQLARLYVFGAKIDWTRHYADTDIPRIEAPTYPFDETRCWCLPIGHTGPAGETTAAAVPPGAGTRTGADAERRIADIWEAVLKATDVDADSHYFELGGTSVAGISVLRQIEDQLGAKLNFMDLYEYPTVRELAGRVDGLRSTAGASRVNASNDMEIASIPRGGRLPLSFGQEQLWYLDQLNPHSPFYNVPIEIRWQGPLDQDALAGALDGLAARHEVLRTQIRTDDGEPYVLDAGFRPRLPVVDLTELPETHQGREVRRLYDQEAGTPTDLATGPLWRTKLLKLAEEDHVLLLTFHHIIFDGWTPKVLVRDLSEMYRTRLSGDHENLPALPVQYADFAAWHSSWLTGERLDAGLSFWRAELAGLTRTELPIDRPRPQVQSFAGALINFTLGPEVAHRVREFSRQEGVTPFVTMLAAVDALIHRWSGSRDVVVGVGTSGRFNPATHDLIGYFNNVLPFRTAVDSTESFRELVRRCTTTVAGVLDHEWVPLSKIVSDRTGERDSTHNPLFDIAYTHQNAPAAEGGITGVQLSSYDGSKLNGLPPGVAKFDLTIGVVDQNDGPMQACLEYSTDLFEPATAQRLVEWFQGLLRSVMDDPDRPVGRLALPGPGSRVSVFDGARRTWPDEPLLWERAQAHALERPEHPAVVSAGRTYTYRQVNRLANRLARQLIESGVTVEVPVAVIAERGLDLVVGWLGVAKAGGAYVPVDPCLPRPRIEAILAEVDPSTVVVSDGLAGLGGPHRTILTVADVATDGSDDRNPSRRACAASLAYIVHTSGSTGRPHGCEIDHAALANLAYSYRDEIELGPDDRYSQMVPSGFDVATMDVWTCLASGATLHFVPAGLSEPGALLRWMVEQEITVSWLPTPLAEVVLTEATWPAGLRLRLLALGGDRMRAHPPADTPFRVYNMYGPSECTVAATAGPVRRGPAEVLPDIGRPMPNTGAYILDERAEPVRAGRIGELYLGGAGVGRGYHRLPELTATRFVADPFAGEPGAVMYRTGDLARARPDQTIEFCGRADDQVEINGNRVEPAEIERTLVGHPQVREAAVIAVATPAGALRLIAHVAGDAGILAEQDLIAWVAAALPHYMVPSRVLVSDSLPKTPNGKLDRKRMRELLEPVNKPIVARGGDLDSTERVLSDIWCGLLGLDRVGPDDNFFELGGDSVLAVRVVARAVKAGIELTQRQFVQHRTLRALAAAVTPAAGRSETRSASVPAPEPRPAPSQRSWAPITPIMQCFVDGTGGEISRFLAAVAVETKAGIDSDAVRAAVEHLVALHEPLRYRFPCNGLSHRARRDDRDLADVVDVKILPPLPQQQELAYLEKDRAAMGAEIDMERGPVFRVRYYDRGSHRSGMVVLLVHHFVCDNVSVLTLLDDLDAALGELEAGRQLRSMPPRPAVWWEWSEHLHGMAQSNELAEELEYWTAVLRAGATLGRVQEADRPVEAVIVQREIAADQLAPVLADRGTAGYEAAYAAMACGLARWRGEPGAFVWAKGEATQNRYRPQDRSTAVGWFTTLHPLVLPVDPEASVSQCLPAIRDRIRAVPHDGVGYGVLRHMTPHSAQLAEFRALPQPEITVSHTPDIAPSVNQASPRLQSIQQLNQPTVTPFPFGIATSMSNGTLTVTVRQDGRLPDSEMEKLADHIVAALAELSTD